MTEYIGRNLNEGGILSGVEPLSDVLALFFVQAVIIMGICRGLSIFGGYLRQPTVIFEIIGGIILGPSAIGRNEHYIETIFPTKSLVYLQLVANIGLVLYLFLVGLELDPKLLITHGKSAGMIAIIGMGIPFALGIAVSGFMIDILQNDQDNNYVSFFVFIGTAMSITAFPVLARILKEGGLIYTRPGALVMGAAAINDAIAWCLLTLAISLGNAGNIAVAGENFACVVAFAAGLFTIVRVILEKIVTSVEAFNTPLMDANLFAFILICVFLSAWTTQVLGVHYIFGAFLFGLIVPRESKIFHECVERMEKLILIFTLPLYFAISGLKTDITTIKTNEEAGMAILVIVIATFSKFIGCGFTAFFISKLPFRESCAIAVLMNTRGLIELIVLNLGLSAGILNTKTFSVMVIMCLVTTFMTNPLVEFILPVSMRSAYLTDAVKSNIKEKDPASLGDLEVITLTEEPSDVEGYKNLLSVSVSTVRLGLVVDRLEHLQAIMDITACFEPLTENAEMAVIAMKFQEPTYTARDEFLALTENDRLIKVEEEVTDITDVIDPTIKKPELLPLSMFCKALGSSVSSFFIQGDPLEFPFELKSLLYSNDCGVSLIPWRPSLFLQKFFWSTIQLQTPQLALLVTLNVAVPIEPEGRTRTGSITAVGGRARSHSSADNANNSEDAASTPTELYSNVPRGKDNHRKSKRASFINIMSVKKGSNRKFKSVCAVITGKKSDSNIYPIVLRMALRKGTIITVLVTKDININSNGKLIYDAFKTLAKESGNIFIQELEIYCNDINILYAKCNDIAFDLLLSSFLAPVDDVAHTVRNRSNTVSAMITSAFSEPEDYEKKIKHGIPEVWAKSSLTHVELGVLGNMIYDNTKKTSNLLIFHDNISKTVLESLKGRSDSKDRSDSIGEP